MEFTKRPIRKTSVSKKQTFSKKPLSSKPISSNKVNLKKPALSQAPNSHPSNPNLSASSSSPQNNLDFNFLKKTKFYIICGSMVLLLGLAWGAVNLVKSIDVSSVVFSAGKNLKTDVNGNTNILLLGAGGKGHDGEDLTDTIMVASINYDQNTVALLSIPRDLYILDKKYQTRINNVYSLKKRQTTPEQAFGSLRSVISDIVGLDINYYIKIDFNGFKKIVDTLDGIHVNVQADIHDTQYPKAGTYLYETFSLQAGPQTLDGETALKYVRSRHGQGNESADHSRTRRQQEVIQAIKDKALSLNILTNPAKIQAIYASVMESIETDLILTEMIELARVAKDLGKESLVSRQITDNPEGCGGFLYTPPREHFGNASVLLPAGQNYDFIHVFTEKYFEDPALFKKFEPIQVLNGTKTRGLAGELGGSLTRLCFNVTHIANAENRDLATSTLYYTPLEDGEKPPLVELLQSFVPITAKAGIPEVYLDEPKEQGTLYVLEIGKDYLDKKLKDPYNALLNATYSVPRQTTPPPQNTNNSTESETTDTPANEDTSANVDNSPEDTGGASSENAPQAENENTDTGTPN